MVISRKGERFSALISDAVATSLAVNCCTSCTKIEGLVFDIVNFSAPFKGSVRSSRIEIFSEVFFEGVFNEFISNLIDCVF